MAKADNTPKIVVFTKVLQSLNFTGVRMVFPYLTAKGETKYAALNAEDLFKCVKWDVDRNGNKPKKVAKAKKTKRK